METMETSEPRSRFAAKRGMLDLSAVGFNGVFNHPVVNPVTRYESLCARCSLTCMYLAAKSTRNNLYTFSQMQDESC